MISQLHSGSETMHSTTDDILEHMTFSISILYLYLHLVFIAVPKVETLTLNYFFFQVCSSEYYPASPMDKLLSANDYYDLGDYEIVIII